MKAANTCGIVTLALALSLGIGACDATPAGQQSDATEDPDRQDAPAPPSEQQTAALLEFIDGTEIATARAFQPKLTSAAARDYAQMLIDDHARIRQARSRIVRLGAPRTPPPQFPTLRAITHSQSATLTALPAGLSFDAAFMGIQAGNHLLLLDSLRSWMARTRDSELRSAIGAAIPVVDGHRERALAIFAALAGTGAAAQPPPAARDSLRRRDPGAAHEAAPDSGRTES